MPLPVVTGSRQPSVYGRITKIGQEPDLNANDDARTGSIPIPPPSTSLAALAVKGPFSAAFVQLGATAKRMTVGKQPSAKAFLGFRVIGLF